MADVATVTENGAGPYAGLRMLVDAFLRIAVDGCNYELIDRVVVRSPSPKPRHPNVTMQIAAQIALYLRDHPIGKVFPEIDVHLGAGPTGGDLVYTPEVVFVRTERLPEMEERIHGAPDLVVAVVSRGSRRRDSETKKDDYERVGVREYWLIDPERDAMTFYRLDGGRYREIAPSEDRLASEAVAGFVLDVHRVRESFKPW